MKIVNRKISELIAAEYNPRQLTEKQHRDLTDSLKRFGVVDPVIVNRHEDRENIIVGGHQRLRIWKELGNEEIPTVEVELDRDKERELNVRLNKNVGEWDWDALANGFDVEELTDWGFEHGELDIGEENPSYTRKIEAPVYEPTGIMPSLAELCDTSKSDELKKEIEKSKIPNEVKEFLKIAAERHTVFDFRNIAEFYAGSDNAIQNLFEKSALVIVDFDKAIESGFVSLSTQIAKLYGKDNPKNDEA